MPHPLENSHFVTYRSFVTKVGNSVNFIESLSKVKKLDFFLVPSVEISKGSRIFYFECAPCTSLDQITADYFISLFQFVGYFKHSILYASGKKNLKRCNTVYDTDDATGLTSLTTEKH